MKRIGLVLAMLLLASASAGAQPKLVDGVSGAPFAWSEWIAQRGPAVVVLWASWVPDAREVLGDCSEIAAVSADRDLAFLLVAVQEPLSDARFALAGVEMPWVHDRHGGLLKRHRVIEVPSVVVISAADVVLSRLPADPEALRRWQGP